VNLTNKGSNLFASHFGKNQSQLKSLNIKIGCTKFSDNGFTKIAKIASTRFQAFDSFAIDLSFCNQITSEGLEKFGSAITQRSIPLQDLFVNLNTCFQVGDFGLKGFWQNFKPVFAASLQKLDLSFDCCQGHG